MASYTYDYDIYYSPSAPVVEIEVGAAITVMPVKLITLIDSGADATLLPAELLKRLGAPRVDTRVLRTITMSVKSSRFIAFGCKLVPTACRMCGLLVCPCWKAQCLAAMFSTT